MDSVNRRPGTRWVSQKDLESKETKPPSILTGRPKPPNREVDGKGFSTTVSLNGFRSELSRRRVFGSPRGATGTSPSETPPRMRKETEGVDES